MESLGAHADKEFTEGNIATEEIASGIKQYVGKAVQLVVDLANRADRDRLISHGKVEALSEVMKLTEQELHKSHTEKSEES